MSYTIEEYSQALKAADAAGDKDGATLIAKQLSNAIEEKARAEGQPTMGADTGSFKPSPEVASPDGSWAQRAAKWFGQGMLSIPGMGGDLNNIGATKNPQTGGRLSDWGQAAPSTEDLMRTLREHGTDISTVEPDSDGGKYAKRALNMGGGMALGPVGSLLQRLLTAGFAAGTGEVAGKIDPRLAPVGEVAGLLAPGYAAAKTPNVVKMLQGDMKEMRPGELESAVQKANETTGTTGVPTLLTQGFDRPTAMEGYLEAVTKTPHGADARQVLARQLAAMEQKSSSFANDMSKLPTDQKTAGQLGDAWQTAVNKPNEWRSQMTDPYLNAVKDQMLSPTAGKALENMIAKKRAEMELGPSRAGAAMDSLGERLAADKDPTVLGVGTAAREEGNVARKVFNNPNADANQQVAAVGMAASNRTVQDALRKGSPEYDEYMKQFKRYSGPVDEMNASKMPGVFDGGENSPSWSSFTKILTDKDIGPDQIKFMARNLGASDKGGELFGTILKKAWTDKLNEVRGSAEGRTPQQAIGQFVDAIAGPDIREKTMTAIGENARLRGMDPKVAQEDAAALFDAGQVISRSRGGLGMVNEAEMGRAAGSNIGSATMRTPGGIMSGGPAAMALDRLIAGKTYDIFMEVMTDPTKAHKLAELVRYSPYDQRGKTFLTGLMGMEGSESKKLPPEGKESVPAWGMVGTPQ